MTLKARVKLKIFEDLTWKTNATDTIESKIKICCYIDLTFSSLSKALDGYKTLVKFPHKYFNA